MSTRPYHRDYAPKKFPLGSNGHIVIAGSSDYEPAYNQYVQVIDGNLNLVIAGRQYLVNGVAHEHEALKNSVTGYIALEVGTTLDDGISYIEVNAGASGVDPSFEAAGSSSDVGIDLVPKGTGKIYYDGTEISKITHNHDGVYEPASGDIQTHITTVSGNPHDVTYSEVGAASTDHNHDDTYLALHATADDSALFNGASASEYATAGHDHDGVYEPASSDIQTHITAVSGNPHDVTYTDVGAASTDHIHDMEDVIVDTTLRLRPQIDFGKIQATSKPTLISRGVLQAYSLPIYNSDNEELFINQTIPRRWDEASDIIVGCDVAIDTANDSKNFRLELAWENITTGDVIPTTSNAASTDTNTGTSAAQYTTYGVQFTIDYDIDGVGNEIAANDILAMRLRRVAATSDEITGEVLVYGFYVQYNRDKIGP